MKKTPEEMGPGTVHLYIRASTGEQQDTLVAQQEKLEEEYKRRWASDGWRLGRAFVDSAVSGALPLVQRPAGYEQLKALRRGDAVLVTALDRMFRSVKDLVEQLERWEREGVQLSILNMTIDGRTAIGRYLLTNLGAVAQLERDLTAERTRAIKESRKARGLPNGGRYPPYGFKCVGRAGQRRYVPCPEQRALGRQIVDWFSRGWTQDQIHQHLADLGTLNPNTKEPLGRSTVWRYYVYETELQQREAQAQANGVAFGEGSV